MNWYFLLGINILFGSVATLLQRILMKDSKSDAYSYGIVFQLLVSVLIGLFAFYNGFDLTGLTQAAPYLALVSVLYAIATLILFTAFKTEDTATVTVLTTTRTMWMVLASVLLLNEGLTTIKLIGTLLIMFGVMIVVYKKQELKTKLKLTIGQIYALLAGMIFGFTFVIDAYILSILPDVPSYLSIAFALPAILMLIIKPNKVKEMHAFLNPKILSKMLFLGLFYSISAIAIFVAYKNGAQASIVGPISQTQTVLAVLLSAVILKETNSLPRKFIGAIIAISGVALLS